MAYKLGDQKRRDDGESRGRNQSRKRKESRGAGPRTAAPQASQEVR